MKTKMGISKLIGLLAAVLFLAFVYLRWSGLTLISVPFLYAFIVACLVATASHPSVNLPLLLGKNSDGSFPIWSLIIFSPYLLFVQIFCSLRRFMSREPPYTEICEGVYVGGWPLFLYNLPPDEPAIIDCTCELPRTSAVSRNAYMCIPTWDTRAPQPSEIESAVRWACRIRAQKRPVFIHCAFGHGRSVSVACALLVALGMAEDWKEAEKIIRERRPCIQMNDLHRQNLEEWSKFRLSPNKKEESSVGSLIVSGSSKIQ